jgi:glycosyltransferase involved in cell wall biosynthesis
MRIHPSNAKIGLAVRKLRQLIRQQGYDVVETSLVSPSVMASLATWGTRVRHVAGIHQVFSGDNDSSKRHMFLRLSARLNRQNRYYAISDYVADDWIRYSRTSARHIRRIYNSISDDCFGAIPDRGGVRGELGLSEDGRIAIYVGRLAAYKGLDSLLDALGPVLKQQNLFLLFVGHPDLFVNGTREMLQQMEQQIVEKNWGDRVKFLSFRNDVPRLMASADVLVHPTQKDGFGLVLAEAMAVGLPVVTSNVEGIPEVVAGTNSIMVPQDDPVALCNAVLKTLNRTSDEVASAIEKGRHRVQFFRTDVRTDAMINLFEDVLSDRF